MRAPKALLDIPSCQQKSDSDCLAACAAAVLQHLGASITYARLLQLLDVRSYGAPAGNIRRLADLNLCVSYSLTTMDGLRLLLSQGHPVIVFVRTGDLPYWSYNTDHAVLVVGYDDSCLYVNDPFFESAPIAVPHADFELAWLERDYAYAIVTF